MRYKVEKEKMITLEEVERLVKAGAWMGTYTPTPKPDYNVSRSGEQEQSQQQPQQ